MQRVRRIASMILLASGLLLGVLWIGSAWFSFSALLDDDLFGISSGSVWLIYNASDVGVWERDHAWRLSVDQHDFAFVWFDFFVGPGRGLIGGWWVTFPVWLPAAILILLGIWGIRATRRFPVGACQACGYDLRGSESERCSECGAAIKIGA